MPDRPKSDSLAGPRAAFAIFIIVAVAAAAPLDAAAGKGSTVTIGTFTSTKQCTIYQESEGSAGYRADSAAAAAATFDGSAAAARSSVSAYATWRTWLVKDCVDHFKSLRTSLQAALAASDTGLIVTTGAADLTASGAISDIRTITGTGFTAAGEGYGTGADKMAVSFDITVRDRQGRILFGAPITKSIDLSSSTYAGNISTGSTESGEGIYAHIQQDVAMAAARAIAFHFRPLTITAINGKTVSLNYGAPYLQLGSIVQIIGNQGGVMRTTVIAAGPGTAVARVEGSPNLSEIAPGAAATFIDSEDPAANGRRFEKKELP